MGTHAKKSRGGVCIVSSCGGHLTEVRRLRAAYAHRPHFYVLNDRIELPDDMRNKTVFIRHAERDVGVLINVFEAWRILRAERPTLILSTGAGPVVPFCLVGKLLRIPTVFIETFTRVSAPSMTGKIMYRLTGYFFYQWKSLEKFFPRATHGGKNIKVPARRINQIVHGKRAITADTALRLGLFFGMEEAFWLNLQSHYDLVVARIKAGDRLKVEVVPRAA